MPMKAVLVRTTITQIVPYNDKRLALALQNNGQFRVFISEDPQNVQEQGFPLDPGVMVSLSVADGDQPWWNIYGIAVGGTSEVRVYEGFST
jgi:hypothetical protein